MKRTKSFTRALILSILAMLMVMTFAVGATFAWFTSKVHKKIVISTGELKVTLEKYDEEKEDYVDISDDETPVFAEYHKWEPGYTTYAAIRIANRGNLALTYTVQVSALNKDAEKLADAIEVYYLDDGEADDIPTKRSEVLTGFDKVGTLKDLVNLGINGVTGGFLKEKGNMDYAIIALHMMESAGNEYMGIENATFDITIFATQYMAEDDDFGPDYDADAEFNSTFITIGGEVVKISRQFEESIKRNENDKVYAATAYTANDLMVIGMMDKLGEIRTGEGYGATITIGADLDMEGVNYTSMNSMFLTIDGQGHTISNLSSPLVGYFGGGLMKDIVLHNVTASGMQVGAIAGQIEGGTLSNVTLSGNINLRWTEGTAGDEAGIGVICGVWVEGTLNNVTIADDAKIVLVQCADVDSKCGEWQDEENHYFGRKHWNAGAVQEPKGEVITNATVEFVEE